MLQPPSPGSFVWFSLICSRGGATAAVVTLDTVADESRKKMADGLARSPSRLCSIDGKICCYEDALSTIFLLLCLASYFSFFVFLFSFFFFSLHPGMFIFFVSLRLCSSHLLPSESTYLVFYNTCSFCLSLSFAPYPISEFYPLFV